MPAQNGPQRLQPPCWLPRRFLPRVHRLRQGAHKTRSRAVLLTLLGLAALAVLPYVPFLNFPLISDSYVQVMLGRQYGPAHQWPALMADPLYRCRATSLILTYWTERFFGVSPLAFHASSVFLHVLNTWLLFALGAWRPIAWKAAAVAAGFFAFRQGHEEAVVWYAALPELLVFFFSLLAFLFWVQFLKSSGWRFLAAALLAFVLALASKESAVAMVPLLILTLFFEQRERLRHILALAPFAGLAALYAWAIFACRAGHAHFHDGTFSLVAPFGLTLWRSTGRLFWIWGFLALLALLAWRGAQAWRSLLLWAFAWVAVTFLPYSFLTYMPHVPSRHMYLASVGVALVVAAGLLTLREPLRPRRAWVLTGIVLAMFVQQCGYTWTKKYRQYMLRAAPTERLVAIVLRRKGPVYVRCFPYSPQVAMLAVELRTGKPRESLLWNPEQADDGEISVDLCTEGAEVSSDPIAATTSPVP